MLPFHYHGL